MLPDKMPVHRVIDVDRRGRVSLARFGIRDTQLIVEELDDGGVALHPAIVMTPAEARHYANPEAVAAFDAALASAREGDVHSIELRSDRD
jgi:hypothetical protein